MGDDVDCWVFWPITFVVVEKKINPNIQSKCCFFLFFSLSHVARNDRDGQQKR